MNLLYRGIDSIRYWFYFVCRYNVFTLAKFLYQMLDVRCTGVSFNVGIGNEFFASNICVGLFTSNVMLNLLSKVCVYVFMPNVKLSLYRRVSQCRNR